MILSELASKFRDISGSKANEAIVEARAKEAALIFRDLMLLTPKDTGQLAANWRPSTDKAVSYEEGMTTNPNTVRSVYEYAKNIPITKDIYLANGTPYAKYVNDGTDKMAPRSFVEAAILRSKNRKVEIDVEKV